MAGCANTGRAERDAYLTSLVGMDEVELIRTIGVPTRTVETGGHRFLAYVNSRLDILPGAPGPFGYGWGPWGYGGGFPPEVVERRCDTTFELVGGKVAGWSQRGNGC